MHSEFLGEIKGRVRARGENASTIESRCPNQTGGIKRDGLALAVKIFEEGVELQREGARYLDLEDVELLACDA